MTSMGRIKKTRRAVSALAGLLLLGTLAAPAGADGRDLLGTQVAQARRKAPEMFHKVARLVRTAEDLDRTKRGRYPIMAPLFRALGKDALLPMLEVLVRKDAHDQDSLSPDARVGLRVGLLEAIGSLDDLRAVPALRAVLEETTGAHPGDYHVLRAAAAALAHLGSLPGHGPGGNEDGELVTYLIERVNDPSFAGRDKALAVIDGMGECRRLEAAIALADKLASAQKPGTTPHALRALHALVRSLGRMASSWAWQTPRLRDLNEKTGEGDRIRNTAAQALVWAYAHHAHDAALGDAIVKALLLADAPETQALLAEAEARHHPAPPALAELRQRLAANPLH
jgi:hypothetical protein